jgi:peptide/nickel transport system substrate-binding protein
MFWLGCGMLVRRAVVLLAGAAVVAGALAACTDPPAAAPDRFASCWNRPADCNGGARRAGGTFTVALPRPPATFNVLTPDSTVESSTIMASIAPGAFVVVPSAAGPASAAASPDAEGPPSAAASPSAAGSAPTVAPPVGPSVAPSIAPEPAASPIGQLALNSDLLLSAKLTRTSPQTVVYQIAPGAAWDDGTPISADDFVYAWRTQTGAAGYDRIASVQGSAGGRTVTVAFREPYADWQGLFAALYPAHIESTGLDMSTQDGVRAAFARQADSPKWTGGPYRIQSYDPARRLVLVPNPKWYGKQKPTLDRVVYQFISDQAAALTALAAGQVDAVRSAAPSQQLLDVLAGTGAQYQITPGPICERIDLNVDRLPDPRVRQAILTAIDVDAIMRQTVRDYYPSAQRLTSHTLMPGTPGHQPVLTRVAPEQGSGNAAQARILLGGASTPVLRLVYARGDPQRETAARLVRRQLGAIGIQVRPEATGDLVDALDRRDYDLVLYGFPASPLLGGARDQWASDGVANHTGWGDPQSDALLKQAARELDPQRLHDELNQQDEILTKAAVVLPLYLKPELLALRGDYVNVRDDPGGVLSYDAQLWGVAS